MLSTPHSSSSAVERNPTGDGPKLTERRQAAKRFFDHARLAQGGQETRDAVPYRRACTVCGVSRRRATLATGSKFHIPATVSKCRHIGAGETAETKPLHVSVARAFAQEPQDDAVPPVPPFGARARATPAASVRFRRCPERGTRAYYEAAAAARADN
ncbi:hypothetical protein HPB50_004442 [Hyalomma asiaticum]|uniref:Uncharacterized protein n=1 Tax=Hyalomma asiaticum TaxID=266040 RepID=A0ACB7TCK3_HYAAI|nr:hypothetical protein HPB50_004442 [Hyalomma asiaticum]